MREKGERRGENKCKEMRELKGGKKRIMSEEAK